MMHDVSMLDYRLQRMSYRLQNPFKCSEMILNFKGKMIDEVNRTEGDLQTTEDDQNFHLAYRASRNPFECYEIMGTIK